MPLVEEIDAARKDIVSDGYEMSIGELSNLYSNKEISISPDFQRLFRWEPSRKTRFIESLLLGIPIPPIFVYQDDSGVWELIDGLQRLSTVFEFMGILIDADGNPREASTLEGTRILPSLSGMRWEETAEDANDGIGKAQQLQIKRARIRVEILKQESGALAKYELFQRLNTGGVELSEQEVRNCVAVMLNKELYEWLLALAADANFLQTIDQTETAIQKQSATELALRFIAFRNKPYEKGLDVHEYLDGALVHIFSDPNFDREREGSIFHRTFAMLQDALGEHAFKRWSEGNASGMFLMSVFEVLAIGTSKNIDAVDAMGVEIRRAFLKDKARDLWNNQVFVRNSGAGVRGTTRLANLLPLGEEYLRP